MSGLQIFLSLGSQPSRAVRALIDIGHIQVKLNKIDIFKKEHKSKEYLDMYPTGKIPVLKKGDFVLGESGAIMIYLCETNPHLMPYYGTTAEGRAKVNQHLSWYLSYFRMPLFKPTWEYLKASTEHTPIFQEDKSLFDKNMFDAIKQLDDLIASNQTKYIAGNSITFVDFLFYFEMTNLIYFGQGHNQFKSITEWYSKVYQIPEIKVITNQWMELAKIRRQMFSAVKIKRRNPF